MNEALLWAILSVTAVTAVLVVILLILANKASDRAGREVRDELRMSREEARSAAKLPTAPGGRCATSCG